MKHFVRITLLALACAARLSAENALHLGFMDGVVGSEIEIPVYRSGSDPAGGASVDFRFNPARMEFKGVVAGADAADWTLDSEQTVADEVRLLLTHPTGAELPVGELARVRVKLLETFPHSEATGTALVRRGMATPAAVLASALWLPWLEITAPAAESAVSNSTAGTVNFRLTPGEHPIVALTLRLQNGVVLTAPSPADRSFSWTPNLSSGGRLNLSVAATDDANETATSAAVPVVINTPPALAAISALSGDELSPLGFTASGSDSDLPANTLTYSLVGAPSGAAINPSTGVFSWTPTEAQGPGSFNFTVRVSDGELFADQTASVTVREVNTVPILAAITDKTVNELALLTFTANATDVDLPANTLTYSLIGAPSGAAINPNTGAFSWTPSEAQGPGTFNFSVRVSDGAATTDQPVKVTVGEVNIAPVLAAITDKTVNELSLLTFSASATDADLPANTLTYSLMGAPTGASINSTTGAFSWTPTEARGPGTFNFTVRVSDGTATTDQPVKVTVGEVNIAPVLAAITDKTINELAALTFTASATDADLPANTLTYSLISAPTGAAINPTTGAFSWTPTEAQGPGTFNFTVRVSDGTATTDQPVKVTVGEVNIAPVLAAITDKTINELATLTFTASATDADLPANTLTYSLISAPTGAAINPTTGAFSWTPTEAQGPGTFNFTVRVSDGTATTDQPVKVTVGEVNIAPVLAAITDKTINELATLTFTASATDADLPANTLTYSLMGAPTGAAIHPTTGAFSWTPTEEQGPGIFNFTVRVSDGTATTDQPVKVTVGEVNIAPVLAAITDKTVNELATLTFTASATDADLPANTLTYSLIGAPTGAAIHPTTGAFSWTPTEEQGPGIFDFTVRVSDGTATTDQPAKVTVGEANIAPVLAAITDKKINELAALTFTASATDADLPANTLTYSLMGAPTGAAITPTTGAFSWTPTEAQGPGTFNFTVRVSDGTATTDQLVKVTVSEVNVAPVLAAIGGKTVNERAPLTFTATATDADLPANTLTFSLVDAPAGTHINPNTGIFSWTPGEIQAPGLYFLTVRVSDGNSSDEETVVVTVLDITPPVLTMPSDQIAEATGNSGAVVNFAVSANDLVDGAVTATATPASGSTFPLGVTTVNVISTDAAGNTRNGSFTVTVRDTTGPELTLPVNQVVVINDAASAVCHFAAEAVDLVDGVVPVIATPPSGSLFALGTTVVQVSATDTAGNVSNGQFKVTVVNLSTLLRDVVIRPAKDGGLAGISGSIIGGPPGGVVVMQASADLGKDDPWEDIGTMELDINGNATFGPISDPHSQGVVRDFFRLRIKEIRQ